MGPYAPPPAVQIVRVPVLGLVPAGIPIEAIEDIVDWEEIPAAPWGAAKAYRELCDGEFTDTVLLIFPDRLVEFECSLGPDAGADGPGGGGAEKRIGKRGAQCAMSLN